MGPGDNFAAQDTVAELVSRIWDGPGKYTVFVGHDRQTGTYRKPEDLGLDAFDMVLPDGSKPMKHPLKIGKNK